MFRTALAALCACASFIPAASQAVYLHPEGLGQALIYAYYTTRPVDGNTYNTFVSIVNHTNDAKALRVRFREGKNGREVASFNLFLGPRDTWVAALSAPPDNSLPTRMSVPDNSCAVPAFSVLGAGTTPFLDFSNASYTGANTDGLGTGNDRTREGYMEVIEMATITGAAAAGVTIGANGRPANCGALDAPFGTAPPTGGLSGTLTLLNVQSGLDFTANADALAQLSTLAFYRGAADPYPDWNSAEVLNTSYIIANDRAYRMTWQSGLDAVNAALTRQALDNEVILDAATQSSTDWIVTFPTKRLYPNTPTSPFPTPSVPFGLNFQARDGANLRYVVGCGFLCPPNTFEIPLQLDWASTVVGFRNSANANASAAAGTSGALGSTNAWIISLPQGVQNGSASLSLGGRFGPATSRTLNLATGDLTVESWRVEGTAVVGFNVRTFRNGNLSCAGAATCQGNYGGMFMHEARRSIGP